MVAVYDTLILPTPPTSTVQLLQSLRRPYRGDFSFLAPPNTIVLEGYLQKKGRMVRSWKTRWIVLTKSDLSYYVDETKEVKRGSYHFTADTQIQIEDGRTNRLKFGLTSPTSRTRVFLTSNEESRELWVNTLQEVLNAYRDMIHMGEGSVWGEVLEGEEKDETEDVDVTSNGNHAKRKKSFIKAGTRGEELNLENNIQIRFNLEFHTDMERGLVTQSSRSSLSGIHY